MSKTCGSCGRFMSPTEAARCQHCGLNYHRRCVALPITGKMNATWLCPDCSKTKAVKKPEVNPPAFASTNSPTISPNNSGYESTHELTQEVAEEMKMFRDHLRSINSDLKLFREELTDIRTTLKVYHKKVDNLEERVSGLERQRPAQSEEVGAIVSQLRQDIRDRDQELLANDVEIANLHEAASENPIHLVVQLGVKLGINIDERDIVSAERVGSRHIVATEAAGPEARPRPLAVRLARRDVRDALLSSARARRGATSDGMGLPGAPRRFYVNERLTKANRQLFRSAREAGQRHGWRFVWVKRGRILARNKPGDKTVSVKCEADIEQVFGQSSSSQ